MNRGDTGLLSHVEIDTAHFKGNFPESCEVHAVRSAQLLPQNILEDEWSLVLPRTKLGPHRQHYFQLENVDAPYTHIRVTIYPDGGIKRVRVIGSRVGPVSGVSGSVIAGQTQVALAEAAAQEIEVSDISPTLAQPFNEGKTSGAIIPALSLTAEAFAPFGQVIQAYSDLNAVPSPRTTRITGANQGTAIKFHKLSLLHSSYPQDAGASAGLSVYRCQPISLDKNGEWNVRLMERHPCTNQAFIPMGGSSAGDALVAPGSRYLVIVAPNGEDDKPDLKSVRAFVASAGQGIVYNTGIWRASQYFAKKNLSHC